MNNISEQILSTIDIITNDKISQLRFDKTIQATIYSVVDINTGEYKVKYETGIFSAFSDDTSKTYRVDDSVYVTVPEGDFSGRKVIRSLVSATSLSEAALTSLANSVNEVSPNFTAMYGQEIKDLPAKIMCYEDNTKKLWSNTTTNNLFIQYANNYEYIQIKASFLTTLYNNHSSGKYGLTVTFNTLDGSKVSYNLDTRNFNGSYYRFSTYAQQSIILKVQKGYLTGISDITFFSSGFDPEEGDTGVENLYVKDIEIKFVEKIDLSSLTNYLYIAHPYGNIITTSDDYYIQARLIVAGKDIMGSKTQCQWYVRDLNVVLGSADYDAAAGTGWRRLEGETASSLSKSALGNIEYSQRYKVVVLYNDELTLEAETEIWNNVTDYAFEIQQVTKNTNVYLQLVNNKNNDLLLGKWFLSYPDDSYSSVTEEKSNEIDITNLLKYDYITFYCGVYAADGETYLGELDFTVRNSESADDVIIRYSGESSFRYDANGDITIEDSEKSRSLAAIVEWQPGYAVGYSVSWKMANGEAIAGSKENAVSPSNSMIVNPWVDNYNVLHYNIRQKYKTNYNNNTVIVTIHTITGEEYFFEKEIIFIKDGDQGTNGTTYIAAIRPSDEDGVQLSGFQGVWYKNIDEEKDSTDKTSQLYLRCYVYRDGELINNNKDIAISYGWNCVGCLVTDMPSNKNDELRWIKPLGKAEDQRYVTVQVTIKDSDKTTCIYASYPIDTLVSSDEQPFAALDLSNIPSYVKYTASGRYPSYYSNVLNYIITFSDNSQKVGDNISSLNENLIKISESKYLNPVTVFNFEDQQIGVLEIKEDSWIVYHPVIMYLDTYGNEAINGWDGTKLSIDGEEKYLFAPQIGAGSKNIYNQFTGVVMGEDSSQKQIGLYGYAKGENTFGLLANGSAYFGTSNSQIQITPGEGINLNITDGSDSVFSVTRAGKIKANSGTIGGWEIGATTLSSNNKTIKLDSSATGSDKVINVNSIFTVTADGAMDATSGTIGGWTIGSDTLTGGSWTLSSKGYIYYGDDSYLGVWKGDSTSVFGIHSDSKSVVVEAPDNVRIGKSGTGTSNLTIGGSYIEVNADTIKFKCTNQEGIYARFA